MSSAPSPAAAVARPDQRLEALFEELAELVGQRNAIDGRIVEIVAEVDRDELWGATGARSVAALVAWKTGSSRGTPTRSPPSRTGWRSYPAAPGMREGRLSLDQVGVIAGRAGEGSDAHYAELARWRRSTNCAPQSSSNHDLNPILGRSRSGRSPRPPTTTPPVADQTRPPRRREVRRGTAVSSRCADGRVETRSRQWRPRIRSGASVAEHHRRFHAPGGGRMGHRVARRPHGQHTTVVVHLDVKDKAAQLHLGPLLTDAERQYLTCDATCEVWFERDGRPIGAGRATRRQPPAAPCP